MQPSEFEKRFQRLWDALEKWRERGESRPVGQFWNVGSFTVVPKPKKDKCGNEVQPPAETTQYTAHLETCGRPHQRRLVIMGKRLEPVEHPPMVAWSSRIEQSGGAWFIVTPNAAGWVRQNRFKDVEQLAYQRVKHLTTGDRQHGINQAAESPTHLPLPVAQRAAVAMPMVAAVITLLGFVIMLGQGMSGLGVAL